MGKKAEKYTEKVGLTVSEVLEMIEETVEAAAAPKRKSRKKKEEEVAAPVKTKEERLNDLITKGKTTHKLSAKEVMRSAWLWQRVLSQMAVLLLN